MSATDRARLRATFGQDAARYDRARPGYPDQLFVDLAAAGAVAGARVLEIGCGTGQATIGLARLGCLITAVELSADLAALARTNLAGHDFHAVTAAFEDWPLPEQPFDLVVAATAWHWLDPLVRTTKAADALRPGGTLAVVSTHHIAGGTTAFFDDVQSCYERFDPTIPPGLRLAPADRIPRDTDEFDISSRFTQVECRRYEWDLTYTTSQYMDLLATYSGHLALPQRSRDGMFACIAALIDNTYGGHITKRYLTQLTTTYRP